MNEEYLERAFVDFLEKSENLRRGYLASLGFGRSSSSSEKADSMVNDSLLLRAIYSKVTGTSRNIQEQRLMDFCPGYYLIQLDELNAARTDLRNCNSARMFDSKDRLLLPFLANYSSEYICVSLENGNEEIVLVSHDEMDIMLMHSSIFHFLDTINAFYDRGVYFLDEDGFLDYDFELQGVVGEELNPGVAYWTIA